MGRYFVLGPGRGSRRRGADALGRLAGGWNSRSSALYTQK